MGLNFSIGGGGPADPRKFNAGPQSPIPSAGGLPNASGFTAGQQAQIQSALSAAGIWDTVAGWGEGAWDAIKGVLPKDASGSIDWGAIGGDVVKFVKDHKQDILDGLSAYNKYQRQNQSDKYAKEGLDLAKQHYAEREPLRVAGMAGMLDPKGPDLSALRTQGQNGLGLQAPIPSAPPHTNLQNAQQLAGPKSGNPFATALPVAQPASPAVPASPMTPPGSPRTPQPPRPVPVTGRPVVSLPPIPVAGGPSTFMGNTVSPEQAQSGMDAFTGASGGLLPRLHAAETAANGPPIPHMPLAFARPNLRPRPPFPVPER